MYSTYLRRPTTIALVSSISTSVCQPRRPHCRPRTQSYAQACLTLAAIGRIYQALSTLGHALDRAPGGSFYTLCQSYDFDRRGKIALDSFIAMVVLLENAKRLHAAFDPNRTGTASFDLNQFVWTLALL